MESAFENDYEGKSWHSESAVRQGGRRPPRGTREVGVGGPGTGAGQQGTAGRGRGGGLLGDDKKRARTSEGAGKTPPKSFSSPVVAVPACGQLLHGAPRGFGVVAGQAKSTEVRWVGGGGRRGPPTSTPAAAHSCSDKRGGRKWVQT